MKREVKSALKEVWKEEYSCDVSGVGLPYACGLCGESGVIDTRDTAILYDGTRIGRLFYCICEQGRWRKHVDAHGLDEHYDPHNFKARAAAREAAFKAEDKAKAAAKAKTKVGAKK